MLEAEGGSPDPRPSSAAAPSASRWARLDPRYAIGVLAVGSLLVGWFVVTHGLAVFPLDDAYLVQHNVRVLYTGQDANFGDDPVLSSSTSFLHLLLVTAFAAAMPTPWAALVVAWCATLALALACCRLAALARAPWYVCAALVLIASLGGDATYQLLNGIETGLAMAAITWAFALYLEPEPARRWALPVLCGLLFWIRPELALLAVLLLGARALRQAPAQQPRTLARDGLVMLAVVCPAVLAYWASTGAPTPQTIVAKQHFFADGCMPLGVKLAQFGGGLLQFLRRLGPAALGLLLLPLTRMRWLAAAFCAGFASAYIIALPGAAYHNLHRYMYPLLPWSVLGFTLAYRDAAPRMRTVLALLALLAAGGAALGLPDTTRHYLDDLSLTVHELAPLAQFVRTHVPSTEPVLIHDAGFIADAVPNPLVDVVGLKTRRAAELHAALTWRRCGGNRGEVIAQLARERHAQYLVVFVIWDRAFGLTPGLRALGWTLEPLRTPPVAYQLYRLRPPQAHAER